MAVDAPATAVVPPDREIWVLVATILPSSMAFIASSSLNAVLPTMQVALDVSGSGLLWVVNAYALFLSALIIVGGSLGDHLGRKRIFMIGITVFTTASLLSGFAADVGVLIALRAIQGIGGALMVPGSLAIITSCFARERRGGAIGTWSTFSAIMTVVGAPLGGILAEIGLWQAVFFINVPLGVIALVVLWRYVPESRDENAPPHLDYVGAILATLALAGITYGFTEAPGRGFTDPLILFTLIGGLVTFVAFIVWEARYPYPMVPLSLFRSRTFSGTNLLTLFLYATLGGISFFFFLNIIQIQGYPETIAGLSFAPFGIMLALMSRRVGKLADRIGPRLLLIAGPFITGIGFVVLALPGMTGGPADYWTTYFPAILLFGFGMGLTVAPLTTTVMNSAPSDSTGTASGINNAVSRVAGVLAVAILGGLALVTFRDGLLNQTAALGLSADVQAALSREAADLAEADVPFVLLQDVFRDPADALQLVYVRQAINVSFIQTFRLTALLLVERREVLLAQRDHTPSAASSGTGPGSPQPETQGTD